MFVPWRVIYSKVYQIGNWSVKTHKLNFWGSLKQRHDMTTWSCPTRGWIETIQYFTKPGVAWIFGDKPLGPRSTMKAAVAVSPSAPPPTWKDAACHRFWLQPLPWHLMMLVKHQRSHACLTVFQPSQPSQPSQIIYNPVISVALAASTCFLSFFPYPSHPTNQAPAACFKDHFTFHQIWSRLQILTG